ncbi:MAG: polyphenol oxidase family protein [Candidatus Aminicenantes bacterium]|nr:polyphenol oxidase family protein [Candidatus Aminicenantes bacterium]
MIFARTEAIILGMTVEAAARFLSIPRWSRMPFLVHGFGLANWTVQDLMSGRPGFAVATTRQVHSARVNFLSRPLEAEPVGDGLATDCPGVFLAVRTADCLPILLADAERRVIAALHCGWRGTALGLAEKAVAALRDRYGIEPSALWAAFGPCIQKNCYEVGEDVRRRFEEERLPLGDIRPHPSRPKKFLLDLQAANRSQLLRAGLDPGNMNFIGECTHCERRMSSYRREGTEAGRMSAFVGLGF